MGKRTIKRFSAVLLVALVSLLMLQCFPSSALAATPADSWQLTADGLTSFGGGTRVVSASVMYNRTLCVSTSGEKGARVMQYDGSTWKQINTDGFGDSGNDRIDAMAVYKNSLYAGTSNMNGCQVWLYNGYDPYAQYDRGWTRVANKGFGDQYGSLIWFIKSMKVYNDCLYVGTCGPYIPDQAGIWRYDGTTWKDVAENIVRPNDIRGFSSMEVYNGKLYVGAYRTWDKQCEVWCVSGDSWGFTITEVVGSNSDMDEGFDRRGNTDVRSLASYGGYLYAGTLNFENRLEVFRYDGTYWELVVGKYFDPWSGFGYAYNTFAESMMVYNGNLYLGTKTYDKTNQKSIRAGEIWRFDGTTWSIVVGPGSFNPGFGDEYNTGILTMAVSYTKDGKQRLYAGTENDGRGAAVYATDDGVTWSQVSSTGFLKSSDVYDIPAMFPNNGGSNYLYWLGTRGKGGNYDVWMSYAGSSPWMKLSTTGVQNGAPNHNTNLSTTAMAMHSNPWQVLMGYGPAIGTLNTAEGCEVWQFRGQDGYGSWKWEQMNQDGFGDKANTKVASMVYQGPAGSQKLVVGTDNSAIGCEIWQCNFSPGAGKSTWELLALPGFFDKRNDSASSMVTYNGKLYVGTRNYTTGCEIWYHDGTGFQQVNTDGFGDKNNIMASSMTVFRNKLYVGTVNAAKGAQVWEYEAGKPWKKVTSADGFGTVNNDSALEMAVVQDKLFVGTQNSKTGCQVWAYNGASWVKLNMDGFGKTSNVRISSMGIYGQYLYAGISNNGPIGAEVWRLDLKNTPITFPVSASLVRWVLPQIDPQVLTDSPKLFTTTVSAPALAQPPYINPDFKSVTLQK